MIKEPKQITCPTCGGESYRKRNCETCKQTGTIENPNALSLIWNIKTIHGVNEIRANDWQGALDKANAIAELTGCEILNIRRMRFAELSKEARKEIE